MLKKRTAFKALILCALVLLTACTQLKLPAAPSPAPNTTNPGEEEKAAYPAFQTPDFEQDIYKDERIVLPEVEPFLALDEFPNMDGSTANLPLMAAVMAASTGISYEEATTLVSCSTTPYAYISLVNNQTNLLLVYEASVDTKQYVEDSGVDLEIAPIGRDALVFVGNEDNTVESLAQQQLIDIYRGKITNWSELGGEKIKIEAFQRSATSGSQALFIKLLMKDIEPMEAPVEYAPDEMAGLIEVIAEYSNSKNAIGYSVFYYANYMYTKPGLKFFAVDGVYPSNETIANKEYPLTNDFYAIIRKDEGKNSPARKLYDWLQTDEGRLVIEAAGYIPS